MSLHTVVVNTNGSGAGSASTESPIHGFVMGATFTFGGTPAATTDTVITEQAGLLRTLLTLTNYITNSYMNFQDPDYNTVGALQTSFKPFYISWSKLTVTVAQGVASTTAALTVVFNVVDD